MGKKPKGVGAMVGFEQAAGRKGVDEGAISLSDHLAVEGATHETFVKSGFLQKRGGGGGPASRKKQKRFFVYRDRTLEYYLTQKASRPKEVIPVSDMERVFEKTGKSEDYLGFCLQMKTRTLEIYANDVEDRAEWMAVLGHAIEDYQNEAGLRRERGELKDMFETEVIEAAREHFTRLINTFNGTIVDLKMTNSKLQQSKGAYAFAGEKELDELEILRQAVPASARVAMVEIRNNIEALEESLDLLAMGHGSGQLAAIIGIQRRFRARALKRREVSEGGAAMTLQSNFRGYTARRDMAYQNSAASVIQLRWKQRAYDTNNSAAATVQAGWRRRQSRKLLKLHSSHTPKATAMWNHLLDTSLNSLFFCTLCGMKLALVSPTRRCAICNLNEPAPFQIAGKGGDYSSLTDDEEAELESALASAVQHSARPDEAVKNAIFFAVKNGCTSVRILDALCAQTLM